MNKNQLNGELPYQLSTLTKLLYLDVSFNNLSGAIPEELINAFTNAKEVIICNNYFLRDQNLPEDWLTFDAFQILPNLKSARSVQKESKLDDRSPSKKQKLN